MNSSISQNIYNPQGTIDTRKNGVLVEGSWRQEVNQNSAIQTLPQVARRAPKSAIKIRETFTEIFMN